MMKRFRLYDPKRKTKAIKMVQVGRGTLPKNIPQPLSRPPFSPLLVKAPIVF